MVYAVTLLACVLLVFLSPPALVEASPAITFYLEREWVTLQLNRDGTTRIWYNLSVVVTGEPQQGIFLPMPNDQISDASAVDSTGNNLRVEIERDNQQLKIFFHQDVFAGQSVGIWASATIDRFIFRDDMNPGNVGVQFIPGWWDFSDRMSLRVLILLPPGVQRNEVRTSLNWDNILTEDDRLGVYWERASWPADQQFQVGVSFPARYVDRYEGQGPSLSAILAPLVLISVGAAVIAASAVVLQRRRREPYLPPRLSMEVVTTPAHEARFGRNASVRDDLDPVEASILIPLHPGRIVAMILYSMARKKALRVVQATPSIRVEVLDRPPTLRYYERYMARAIRPDGSLDEEGLRTVLTALRRNVDDKMAYYSRRETREYYLRRVEETWAQVQAAGIPQAKFEKYSENTLWLMVDPRFKERTAETVRGPVRLPPEDYDFFYYRWLPPIIIIQEQPRVGLPTPRPMPVPGPVPAPTPTPQPRPPSPEIPVVTEIEKLANNFVTSVETMTANAVKDVEKATQAIATRAESSTSSHTTSGDRRGASCHCVCACVSCACVCACVSCACACASGGGFCFRLRKGMKTTAMALSRELGFAVDFYPKSLVFPLDAPPRYGFRLSSPRGGSIHIWSQANSISFSIDPEGLTPEEQELMTQILLSSSEAEA